MEQIELLSITRRGCTADYAFRYSRGLTRYFRTSVFTVTYPESVEEIPEGILAVPFAANVLPVSWLADCELILPALDRDFYDSLPGILEGFRAMYPEAVFGGTLTVGDTPRSRQEKPEQRGMFFSGGLDATATLLRHSGERPHLIFIRGSDMARENEAGWQVLKPALTHTARRFGLPLAVIGSSFREFLHPGNLTADFGGVLQTTWWYGIQHGLGLLGHAAPYAWLHGIRQIYIASSNCVEDGKVRCASDPTIDNRVAFCGCSVFHDAYELDRMAKTNLVARFCREDPGGALPLHVCWQSDTGKNCCVCEKCCRMMAGLLIAGENPAPYGFLPAKKAAKRVYQKIALRCENLPDYTSWQFQQRELRRKWNTAEPIRCRRRLRWMLEFDFTCPEENPCRKRYRRTWRWKKKLVRAFPGVYRIWLKLRGYRFE